SGRRLSPPVIKWVSYMQKEPYRAACQVSPSQSEKAEVWQVLQSVFGNILSYPMRSGEFLLQVSH
ncbi:MAG: hypothetical protein OEY44_02940, partial [Candidatus Peregrinibacteria bacterium]|nr:hypothetical protein [Candidatus Peregrinibacteria bacterium]